MLKADYELLNQTKGKVGQTLEDAIWRLSENTSEIFGAILPLNSILVDKEKASKLIFSTAQNYWGDVNLFLQAILHETSIDLENAHDRLQAFFSSIQGRKAMIEYLLIHNSFKFENLIGLVFGKEIKISKAVGGLHQIYLYQIGKKYLVHIIYNEDSNFWKFLFSKKIYSTFMQAPLHTIQNATQLMKQFKNLLETQYTINQSVIIMNQLIKQIDNENIRSYQLKELHLLNLISHFNGGKRHFRKLNALIEDIIISWEKGRWALSEKEHTLLTYILAITTSTQNDNEKIIEYGKQLIQNDRLINHAIELLLEYSDVLPNLKPEPNTLVKRYDKNYLEQIFYILINALVESKNFIEVIHLLKHHEIASCTSIYEYFNAQQFDKDLLHRIEATVQRDIAYIVHNSPQYVLQSIEVWLEQYRDEKSPYYEIANMTSTHVCNILKSLFATEQYELFEKLMEIYKKYFKVDDHFNNLRDFVSVYVKN